jgi:hypothetical protein
MKRLRVSTLMLLVIIIALGTALVVQHDRAAHREAELRYRLKQYRRGLRTAQVRHRGEWTLVGQ